MLTRAARFSARLHKGAKHGPPAVGQASCLPLSIRPA